MKRVTPDFQAAIMALPAFDALPPAGKAAYLRDYQLPEQDHLFPPEPTDPVAILRTYGANNIAVLGRDLLPNPVLQTELGTHLPAYQDFLDAQLKRKGVDHARLARTVNNVALTGHGRLMVLATPQSANLFVHFPQDINAAAKVVEAGAPDILHNPTTVAHDILVTGAPAATQNRKLLNLFRTVRDAPTAEATVRLQADRFLNSTIDAANKLNPPAAKLQQFLKLVGN